MRSARKIKTKYYSKQIVKYLLLAGAVYVAASSPSFIFAFTRNIFKEKKPSKKYKKKITDCFHYLRKKGLVELRRTGHDVCIALTKEGARRAGKYQIDDLYIERPKRWDGRWRVIIFDIPNSKNIIRDVFRRKLKEFGFFPLQRSIWICPFPCKEEINLLREFLGASKKEIQVLEVSKMEKDDFLRKIYHL
ncbi:MAG: hypothetical protein ABIG08_01800 [bacterium]